MDFQGFLNKDRDRRSRKSVPLQDAGKVGGSKGAPTAGVKKKVNVISEVPPAGRDEQQNYYRYPGAGNQIFNPFLNEEKTPDAASEKDLGNEYFKQNKYTEAIECYSRSIGLSPTAAAFANRAMAYLKIKSFEQAEIDCTEALQLDDRYVKAYSRRATARKELGKLKLSMEDSEFAMRLEPNNQELRKQYTETKTLYGKEISLKTSRVSGAAVHGIQEVGHSDVGSKDAVGVVALANEAQIPEASAVQTKHMDQNETNSGQILIPAKNRELRGNAVGNVPREVVANHRSLDLKNTTGPSIQDLASRAASRVIAASSKDVQPKTAYEFEVSWRARSDDCVLQANLLKTIPPDALPRIFKNALSAPMLVDIVKCTSKLFREDAEFALSILDNLVKVPRFNLIVMSLSAVDQSGIRRAWEEVLSANDIPADYKEAVSRLLSEYSYGQ